MQATTKERTAQQLEALDRATNGRPNSNYGVIYHEFAAMGIPLGEILPRVNVFTYAAWQAKGRQVRKGQHGVKVVTYIPMSQTDKATGETTTTGSRPRATTVFHVSQTDPIA